MLISSLFQIIKNRVPFLLLLTLHVGHISSFYLTIFSFISTGDPDRQRPLLVRETSRPDGSKEVFVQGISEYRVSSAKDVLALLQHGGRNRATRATNYNESSSRSHGKDRERFIYVYLITFFSFFFFYWGVLPHWDSQINSHTLCASLECSCCFIAVVAFVAFVCVCFFFFYSYFTNVHRGERWS